MIPRHRASNADSGLVKICDIIKTWPIVDFTFAFNSAFTQIYCIDIELRTKIDQTVICEDDGYGEDEDDDDEYDDNGDDSNDIFWRWRRRLWWWWQWWW